MCLTSHVFTLTSLFKDSPVWMSALLCDNVKGFGVVEHYSPISFIRSFWRRGKKQNRQFCVPHHSLWGRSVLYYKGWVCVDVWICVILLRSVVNTFSVIHALESLLKTGNITLSRCRRDRKLWLQWMSFCSGLVPKWVLPMVKSFFLHNFVMLW